MTLIRSLTRSGSSTPGSSTTIRSFPWRWMSGSATPNWSMRFRIVSRVWATAWSSRNEDGRRFQGEGDPVGHEGGVPVAGVLVDQVPDLGLLIDVQAGDGELARLFLGPGRVGDGVLLKKIGEPDDFLVGFAVEGVVGHDLEHQVDAALEVQAELDFFPDREGHEQAEAQDGDRQERFSSGVLSSSVVSFLSHLGRRRDGEGAAGFLGEDRPDSTSSSRFGFFGRGGFAAGRG